MTAARIEGGFRQHARKARRLAVVSGGWARRDARRDKLRSGCAEVCLTRHDNGTTAGGPGRLARDATTRGTTTARRRAVATTRATRRHDDGTTAGSGLGRLARGYRASGAATAQRLSSHPVRGSSSQCSSQSANSHRAASRKLRSGCAEVLSRRASDQLAAEQSFPPSSPRVPSKRRRNCPSASHRILFVAPRANVRPKVPTPTEQQVASCAVAAPKFYGQLEHEQAPGGGLL